MSRFETEGLLDARVLDGFFLLIALLRARKHRSPREAISCPYSQSASVAVRCKIGILRQARLVGVKRVNRYIRLKSYFRVSAYSTMGARRLCDLLRLSEAFGKFGGSLAPCWKENELVRAAALTLLAAFFAMIGGCTQGNPSSVPIAATQTAKTNAPTKDVAGTPDNGSESRDNSYAPPTAEEMAPMRAGYLAELAKIHEPPEMADKPMQVRKPVSPAVVKIDKVMSAMRSPEKATHEQRATGIRELLEIVDSTEQDDGVDRALMYGAIAGMACIDGVEPKTIIGYVTHAIGENTDDALALRARMYLKAGEQANALNDLERIMVDGDRHALTGGDATPRKESAPCGWSLLDFDAFGDDPRALAAKGLYLSSFIAYGAENKGMVKESDIRDFYARSAAAWRSPIPRVLVLTLDGLGSEQFMARARCMRANAGGAGVPEIVAACAKADEGTREQIRQLTMALVIERTFVPALSQRADAYLQLAQAYYADGKPSRQFFELAIKDFTAAIAAGSKDRHALYCDRGLALASIGRYQEAALGYVQGMKYAKNGAEDSPFVYEQLAGVYMKLGKFSEAADLITQAVMNVSGGGMDAVIFGGGLRAFRTLYPEYDLVPDEILAEAVRRRYQSQLPQSWDRDFIGKEGAFKGKVASSILTDLYAFRGDAYMKAGRRADALADYRRVKSDAWDGKDPYLPRQLYFTKSGTRNYDLPESWPPPPPAM
jgi:tetratricopeptide (TPR) repeat protein